MAEISRYARGAELMIRVAEEDFFGNLSAETKAAIPALLECVALTDNYADSLEYGRKKTAAKNILAFLAGSAELDPACPEDTRRSLNGISNRLNCLPASLKNAFIDDVHGIFECGFILSHTRDRHVFIDARKKEALHTVDIFLHFAPELSTNAAFVKFFYEISLAGNLFDSLEDAHKDKASGEQEIKPVRIYFALAKEILRHSVSAVKAHPHKAAFVGTAFIYLLEHARLTPHPPPSSFPTLAKTDTPPAPRS